MFEFERKIVTNPKFIEFLASTPIVPGTANDQYYTFPNLAVSNAALDKTSDTLYICIAPVQGTIWGLQAPSLLTIRELLVQDPTLFTSLIDSLNENPILKDSKLFGIVYLMENLVAAYMHYQVSCVAQERTPIFVSLSGTPRYGMGVIPGKCIADYYVATKFPSWHRVYSYKSNEIIYREANAGTAGYTLKTNSPLRSTSDKVTQSLASLDSSFVKKANNCDLVTCITGTTTDVFPAYAYRPKFASEIDEQAIEEQLIASQFVLGTAVAVKTLLSSLSEAGKVNFNGPASALSKLGVARRSHLGQETPWKNHTWGDFESVFGKEEKITTELIGHILESITFRLELSSGTVNNFDTLPWGTVTSAVAVEYQSFNVSTGLRTADWAGFLEARAYEVLAAQLERPSRLMAEDLDTVKSRLRYVLYQKIHGDLEKLKAIYNSLFNNTFSIEKIKTSKFAPYLDLLSDKQIDHLRTLMSKHDIHFDVLTNNPMSLFLIVYHGLTPARTKGKKTELFDGLKGMENIPKWLINKITQTVELASDSSQDKYAFRVAVEERINLFRFLRQGWNDQSVFGWIIKANPRFFPDLSFKALANLLVYDFGLQRDVIQAGSTSIESVEFGSPAYQLVIDELMEKVRTQGAGGISSYSWRTSPALMAYVNPNGPLIPKEAAEFPDAWEESATWKSFALDFRDWVENYFGNIKLEGGELSLGKRTKSSPVWGGDFQLSKRVLESVRGVTWTDLWSELIFTYSALTDSDPFASLKNFHSFILQTNTWFNDAQVWTPANPRLPDNITKLGRVEELVRRIRKMNNLWFSALTLQETCNTLGVRAYPQWGLKMDLQIPEIITVGGQQQSSIVAKKLISLPNGYTSKAMLPVIKSWGLLVSRMPTFTLDKFIDLGKNYIGLPFDPSKEEVTFTHLSNGQMLIDEGRTMRHCVGGYSGYCESRDSIIYHVKSNEDSADSTLEFRIKGYNLQGDKDWMWCGANATINQHRAYGNGTPNDVSLKAGQTTLKQMNHMFGSENFWMFMLLLKKLQSMCDFSDFTVTTTEKKPKKEKDLLAKYKKDNVLVEIEL